jgi:hypothetical protein
MNISQMGPAIRAHFRGISIGLGGFTILPRCMSGRADTRIVLWEGKLNPRRMSDLHERV